MNNYYSIDELFTELDQNLKKRPSKELISRIEGFATGAGRQVEKFTIGQILSIAASFVLIAMINFSVLKPNVVSEASAQEELASYQFIPVNSLYNE